MYAFVCMCVCIAMCVYVCVTHTTVSHQMIILIQLFKILVRYVLYGSLKRLQAVSTISYCVEQLFV